MNVILGSLISALTLCFLLSLIFYSAIRLPLKAGALPSFMALTSIVYFYILPVVAIISGTNYFFGVRLDDLSNVHLVVLLYALGAAASFAVFQRVMTIDPTRPTASEQRINKTIYLILCCLAIVGLGYQVTSGKLNVTGSAGYDLRSDDFLKYAFVTQAYNLMIPLTLVLMIRNKFKLMSLLVAAAVLIIFAQIGFRFRILVFLSAAITSFTLSSKIKLRPIYVAAGVVFALYLVSFLGTIRRYGRGVDLSQVNTDSLFNLTGGVQGEIGTVFVTSRIVNNPLPEPHFFDPWTVGLARLVPSFIWPDKPTPAYLDYLVAGLGDNAEAAGIAAPQHVEMLLQAGWIGVPLLSFLYFSLVAWLLFALRKLCPQSRIVGYSLVPVFFGYYMQSRGYFFQILADGLFIFAPLFLISTKSRPWRPLITSQNVSLK